jgi:hypothetical protein
LDCCHYQKRLSPRSKARARRWRSDLGLSGKEQLRSVVFTDTPERILPVHRDCADMVECGVCSPPLQEKAKVSLTPTFMEVSYRLEPNSQQKPQQVTKYACTYTTQISEICVLDFLTKKQVRGLCPSSI